MNSRNVVAVVSIALALAGTACKRTQEGESKAWDRNIVRAQELSALYPGFAPAIQAQLAKAKSAMDAARAVSSPEEAAKKMAEANSLLSGGFMGGLGGAEAKVKQVREKIAAASASVPAGPEAEAIRPVVAEAQRALGAVDEAFRRGASEPIAAAAIVRKADGELADAAASLDRVVDAAKKRQEAAKAAPGSAATAAGAASAAPKAVPATWKCSYCGRVQEGTGSRCSGCGAARK
jgi:hypothetical protein